MTFLFSMSVPPAFSLSLIGSKLRGWIESCAGAQIKVAEQPAAEIGHQATKLSQATIMIKDMICI
jgi:hypothetical protein